MEDERFDITESIIKDPPLRIQRNHPTRNIIGEVDEGRKTRDKIRLNYRDMVRYICYTSCIEPKNVKEVLLDEFWVRALMACRIALFRGLI